LFTVLTSGARGHAPASKKTQIAPLCHPWRGRRRKKQAGGGGGKGGWRRKQKLEEVVVKQEIRIDLTLVYI
jgi:hypothetical protein